MNFALASFEREVSEGSPLAMYHRDSKAGETRHLNVDDYDISGSAMNSATCGLSELRKNL